MEENIKPGATQAASAGNETEVQGAAAEGNKTFTQDEVNRIIQVRLDQMKKQAAKEQETEYGQKLQELKERECRLMMKEVLGKRSLPNELMEVITCADEKELNSKLDILQKVIEEKSKVQIKGGKPAESGSFTEYTPAAGGIAYNSVRHAMGLK